MNCEDIIRMAREASGGTVWWPVNSQILERFAALVAAADREPLPDEHLTALCRQHWDRQANILDHIAYARAIEREHDIGSEE